MVSKFIPGNTSGMLSKEYTSAFYIFAEFIVLLSGACPVEKEIPGINVIIRIE